MEAAALPSVRISSRSTFLPATLLRLRSDEQLVALFRAGSDEAFSAIHERYRTRLLVYARQMLGGSHDDAEDVLQDVFVRAHAALRANESPITLRAWLYRIAHNRCIDGLRRPGPTPSEIMPGARPALARGANHDPPIEAERSEDLRRLVRDLLNLPEQQRSALLMRELQGLSYEELACSLGVSVGAVKSLLVRARSGVLSAAVARDLPCTEIRHEIAAAHDRGVRPSGQSRRHLRECAGCRQHRLELRATSKQLAALAPPFGLVGQQLGLLSGLGGGGGTGGGLAAVGGGAGGGLTGGGAGLCSLGGAAAGKVAALVCAAALVGGASGAFTPGRPAAHHPARGQAVIWVAAARYPAPTAHHDAVPRSLIAAAGPAPVAPPCPVTGALPGVAASATTVASAAAGPPPSGSGSGSNLAAPPAQPASAAGGGAGPDPLPVSSSAVTPQASTQAGVGAPAAGPEAAATGAQSSASPSPSPSPPGAEPGATSQQAADPPRAAASAAAPAACPGPPPGPSAAAAPAATGSPPMATEPAAQATAGPGSLAPAAGTARVPAKDATLAASASPAASASGSAADQSSPAGPPPPVASASSTSAEPSGATITAGR